MRRGLQRRFALILLAALVVATPAFAGKPKPAETPNMNVVDKGSFAIFVSGKRVATEDFTILQSSQGGVAESELKLEDGRPAQSCKLQVTPDGNLERYEWRVLGGQDKSASVLESDNEFLVQHITMPDLKTVDHRYLLTPSISVVDDYFFSQREILIWRYVAGNCRPSPGTTGCELAPAQYGIITPRQQISSLVKMEYVGREKVDYKGSVAELSHFKMSSESSEWHLWINYENKLVKIQVPLENTEVVRQ